MLRIQGILTSEAERGDASVGFYFTMMKIAYIYMVQNLKRSSLFMNRWRSDQNGNSAESPGLGEI